MNIEQPNAQLLYHNVLEEIFVCGQETSPRGQLTKEVTGARLHLPDARQNVIAYRARKLNYYFSLAEWLWILLGQNDVASISRFNSKIAEFSDDGVTFSGAYGPKFTEQLPYVLEKLRSDRDSRQAVLTLWRERPGPSKDVPCTVAFQYLLRGDRLHALTFMRSNDAWLGLPYDLFNFTMLQSYVAAALDVEVGSYTHLVGSLHLYDWSFERAEQVLEEAGDVADQAFTCQPPSYPYPLETRGLFNGLAQPELADERSRTAEYLTDVCDNAGEPWASYLKVLAHRTQRDVPLPQPWQELVSEYGVGS